jgi:hypothetical protein
MVVQFVVFVFDDNLKVARHLRDNDTQHTASPILIPTSTFPWYILFFTDEALATESWRNNHSTIITGNAVKSLPRG